MYCCRLVFTSERSSGSQWPILTRIPVRSRRIGSCKILWIRAPKQRHCRRSLENMSHRELPAKTIMWKQLSNGFGIGYLTVFRNMSKRLHDLSLGSLWGHCPLVFSLLACNQFCVGNCSWSLSWYLVVGIPQEESWASSVPCSGGQSMSSQHRRADPLLLDICCRKSADFTV